MSMLPCSGVLHPGSQFIFSAFIPISDGICTVFVRVDVAPRLVVELTPSN